MSRSTARPTALKAKNTTALLKIAIFAPSML